MKKMCAGSIVLVLLLSLSLDLNSLSTDSVTPEGGINQSHNRVQQFALSDAVPSSEEWYGYTETPEHPPLEVIVSDVPGFDYMAASPYYKVFFKGTTVKMVKGDAWVSFELPEQDLGEVISDVPTTDENSLSISEVFDSVDLSYTVDTSLLTEVLTLQELKSFNRLIQKVAWEGMTPEFQEDGSILFSCEKKEIVRILPPFMKDAEGAVCEDICYDLVTTETGYELHKVLNEEGLRWLEEAVYPVTIDPTIQIIEYAYQSSGFKPYYQYFMNSKEYINPVTGHQLSKSETDLTIPGRGLDLAISRTYETPAVFYGADPYDYEAPPVDVGKGWKLDFPYVGSKYLHFYGGGIYKIEWSGSTFENHKGSHFKLIKNGDDTYTLTTSSGTVYEFSATGELTQIKDLDQNTISFTYSGGKLTTITDTIGRTVSLTYNNDLLWKITYNGNEIEYHYDANGCLEWVEDFLNRRTEYTYNTGYNYWLLSRVENFTGGYTTYVYNRFADGDYYKYYVTDERVYETSQVRHLVYSYTGSFEGITSATVTEKNQSDVTQGSYYCVVDNGLVTQRVVRDASGSPIRKYSYTYNSRNDVIEEKMYYDGSNLSYTTYYSYDDWGNVIYIKNGEGHEQFFSFANTSTTGFFVDDTGTIIKIFTNAFSSNSVPSFVHNALVGAAEKQDSTYVKEIYITYDSEAHPTQYKNIFGNATTWLTYSGTFNEKTGSTSFTIDLTGHTVVGNGTMEITGLGSDDNYTESNSGFCPGQCTRDCKSVSGSWVGGSYKLNYQCCRPDLQNPPTYETCSGSYDQYIGPFTHYPGTLGYQSYSATPSMGSKFSTFSVTAYWKAYPAQVQYNLDNSDWTTISSNLSDGSAKITVPITDGSHTLYFSESSAKNTKFSWYLYVPVDNLPDTYTSSMAYDTYGNVTSITDPESNAATFVYSSNYSHAYVTEISKTVGQDTVTTEVTYDYYRGWVTSIQEPKGVASSGYDTLYTYDLAGRVTKEELPLLSGQSQRSYIEVVYDDTNLKVTTIDQLRHYVVQEYDKLGRLTSTKLYTGTYGSGTLYATESYTYRYDNLMSTLTDPGNDTITYTYDFLGRTTQVTYPDSTSVSYSYDDTNSKITFTNGRGFDRIYWFDLSNRLKKVEEEYATDSFAVTTYQYDESGSLLSFTDAENHTTSYTYASQYGLTKTIYPDSTYEELEYDNVGNVISSTDAKGNETTFTYDSLYRLTQIEYQDETTVSYIYDLNSNSTKMEDDAPNSGDYVEFAYDKWNRLTSETRHISTSTYTISYQYDVANRLTTLTYPDSMQILYSYDDLNRTTEIKRYVDGSNDEILMDNIQYDTESLLTQFDDGNDLEMTFSYDSRDRISTIDVKNNTTSCLDLDYTYDNNNNIAQLVNGWRDTSSTWHSETESYGYDGLNRLTSASCTSWSHTYSYDEAGNRTAKDSVTYTINSVNEVTALSDGASFTYDDNGNRTQKTKGTDTWDYTYDYANRLTKAEKNDTTLGEYVYDGGGRRQQVTENSMVTTYIYSGLSVLYEENSVGAATYIYGPSGLLAKRTTIEEETNMFYYYADHLGSTRLVADDSKNIVSAVTYHPFGETCSEEGSEAYLFNGKEIDETGLYYYGARYYDASLGRFLTRDPLQGGIATPQTMNRFTYCLNNPTSCIDAIGLETYSNVDTGVTIRVRRDGSWSAYDSAGNKITDSTEINDLLEKGTLESYLEAIHKMLQVLGYTEGENNLRLFDEDNDGINDCVALEIDNNRVLVYPVEGGCPWNLEVKGHTDPPKEGIIKVYIFNMGTIDPNLLFHMLGHEMVHVEIYASGKWEEWASGEGYGYGEEEANKLSELAARSWNLANLLVMPCKDVSEDCNRWLDLHYRWMHTAGVPYSLLERVHLRYGQVRWNISDIGGRGISLE